MFEVLMEVAVPEQVMLLDWEGPELRQLAAMQLEVCFKTICCWVPPQDDPEYTVLV